MDEKHVENVEKEENPVINFNLYISKSFLPVLKEFKQIAKKKGLTMSGLIRYLIAEYVKQNKEETQKHEQIDSNL